MSERVTSLSLGVYDQVIALTQYMINSGFDAAYTVATSGDDSPQIPLDLTDRLGIGLGNITLGSPRCIISTDADNHGMVIYRMHITGGTVSLFESMDKTDKRQIFYHIDDWFFAFSVNLGFQGVDETSEKFQEIRTQMGMPGDYTIQTLLVDMSTAQFGSPQMSMCTFGNWSADDYIIDANGDRQTPPNAVPGQPRDPSSMWSTSIRDQFQMQLSNPQLHKKLMDAGLQDLGYSATAKNIATAGHEPTFLPTNLRFQTIPWFDPANRSTYVPTSGLTGKSVLNYLLYLETTGDNPFPQGGTEDTFLKGGEGNWTDGTDPATDSPSKFGTMVISNKNFMDKFFLPKMKKLNRSAAVKFDTLTIWVHQTAGVFAYENKITFSISVGDGVTAYDVVDSGDDTYAFASPKAISDGTAWGATEWAALPALPSGAVQWTFTKDFDEVHSHDTSGLSGIDTIGDVWGRSSICSRLWFVPGTNKLTLELQNHVYVEWKLNPNRLDSNRYWYSDSVTTWKAEFTLQEVSDGGLHINISHSPPVTTWHDDDIDTMTTYFTERFKDAAANFDNLLTGLDNALKGQEKFYFPSRGTFFIKNPIFDHNANILCELEYNGDGTSTTPNPTAIPRPGSITGDFSSISPIDDTSDKPV
ncbi:hypothetical protein EAF04_004357 [Stromatinia cepivora]|nr:hypothetical protein EAF04_004357 [Stromatinia cepivora]